MDDREFRVKEFEIIVGIGRDYFGFYFRSVVLYVATLGVLLKLFLDTDVGSKDRLAVFLIGVGVNISACLGTLAAKPKYQAIARRCDELAEKLEIPNVYFPGTIRVANAFLAGIIIIGISWLLLLPAML
jgi:hypothetical protein